jgi:hypothetical protein
MSKINNLLTGTFIVLLLFTIFILIYYYLEYDDDKHEIYLRTITDKRSKLHYKTLATSCGAGFIRGLLMGMLLGDIETGLLTGISVAIVNPLMIIYEYNVV